MLIPLLFAALLVCACTMAAVRGGPSERFAAAVILVGSITSGVAQHMAGHIWDGKDLGTLAIDLAMLATFVAIMLVSRRFWPIWVVAAQFLTVLAHLGPLFRQSHISIPFAISEQIWSWWILGVLIIVMMRQKRPHIAAQ